MKIIYFTFSIMSIILMFAGCVNDKSESTNITPENWKFRKVGTKKWHPAEVPGHIHTDLLNNGMIPDPFMGTNELDIQWIENEHWEYLSSLYANQELLNHDKIDLTFEGLDTYTDIFLNDSLILQTNNMFIPWSIDVKKCLKIGENNLRIYFHSPVYMGQEKLNSHPRLIPASNENKPIGKQTSVFTRKSQYHYGWDWSPRLVTSGIWRPVTLIPWNGARIRDVFFHLDSLSEPVADYTVEFSVESIEEMDVELTIRLDHKTTSHKIQLNRGLNNFNLKKTIENPNLWWPNGYGKQHRYEAEIVLTESHTILHKKRERIGVRKIDVIQNPDSLGSSFYIQVNDVPIFMKGANYIPPDYFNVRASKRYKEVIQNAVDANMNMLRVWGGAVYENEEFYELCDTNGILIWQDFMFACCMVPGGNQHIQNIKLEAESNVKRLRNHPSIALWCGNNESLTGWEEWNWQNTYSLHGDDSLAVWNTYDHIFHELLPNVVDSLDPGKWYWSSSASSGFGSLQNKFSGDQHEWGVWFGQMPFDRYSENTGRFISEYGLQSLPEMTTIIKMDSTISEWTLEKTSLNYRQRSKMPWIEDDFDGFDMIHFYIETYYPSPNNFEEFVYLSQLTQALGLQTAIHAHRRNKPYTMGSLYWQIDDVWPTVSWSTVDYFGNWKAAHYEVKKANEPILISPNVKNSQLNITIVNDRLYDVTGTLFLDVLTLNGDRIYSTEIHINLPQNSSTDAFNKSIEELLCGQENHQVFLYSYLKSDDSTISENIFYFTEPKNLGLSIPKISTSITSKNQNWIISLTSSTLTKNVFLSFEGIQGKWSDNYFDLLPVTEKTVTFVPEFQIETTKPKPKLMSLNHINAL